MTTETRTALCRMDSAWRKDAYTGYLDAEVYPTKAGVFLYLNKDGTTRRELRPKELIHDPEIMSTLENQPHTNSHPPVLLNSRNTKQYQTGVVYGKHDIAPDGIHTRARVRVYDEAAIRDIESGKEQVSCGYSCGIDNTPGVHPEFGPYDAIQTRPFKYNHLASEWRGRAGAGAAIKRDSDDSEPRFDAVEIELPNDSKIQEKQDHKQEKPKMAQIRIDGRDIEVSEAAEIAVNSKFKADAEAIDKAQKQAVAEKARADQAQAKLDEAQEKIKGLEAIDHDARIDAAIEQREQFKPILGKDYVFKGKSDLQVKKDVIAKLRPEAKLDGQSEAYIQARLDSALEDYQAQNKGNQNGTTVLDALDSAASRSSGWGSEYSLID